MVTTSRTEYEKHLLNDIKDLPDSEMPKILKLVHFFKDEILGIAKGKEDDLQLFWESFGSWKDERSAEEIIKEIYSSRKSTNRDIQL